MQAIRRNQVALSGDYSQSENPEFVQDFSSIREKYAATLEQVFICATILLYLSCIGILPTACSCLFGFFSAYR